MDGVKIKVKPPIVDPKKDEDYSSEERSESDTDSDNYSDSSLEEEIKAEIKAPLKVTLPTKKTETGHARKRRALNPEYEEDILPDNPEELMDNLRKGILAKNSNRTVQDSTGLKIVSSRGDISVHECVRSNQVSVNNPKKSFLDGLLNNMDTYHAERNKALGITEADIRRAREKREDEKLLPPGFNDGKEKIVHKEENDINSDEYKAELEKFKERISGDLEAFLFDDEVTDVTFCERDELKKAEIYNAAGELDLKVKEDEEEEDVLCVFKPGNIKLY